MNVNYTPPLMEQIRGQQTDDRRVVVVEMRGKRVPAVDPVTRQTTADAQQFLLAKDGSMEILPRWKWVETPDIVEVSSVSYR